MPVDVTTEIRIERPREEVAAYAADPDNAVAWYRNITAVRWRSPPPLAAGSEVEFTAQFMGRTMTYTYRIAELDEGRRLVMSTAEGPFPMETTYTWEDAPGGGTHMTLRNRGQPTGFARVSGPLLARAMRRANRADLRDLKGILEQESG
jgi:ligand-binding SRPBCC domain-containing protein